MNSRQFVAQLRARWNSETERVQAIIDKIKKNEDWTRLLVDDDSHEYGPLSLVDDGSLNRRLESDAAPRDLRGLALEDVTFNRVEVLADAHLDFCSLRNVKFVQCPLNNTSFRYSKLNSVYFNDSYLNSVNFAHSRIDHIDFQGSELDLVDFRATGITGCSLIDCTLTGIQFQDELSYGVVYQMCGLHKRTKIRGINHDLSLIKVIETDFRRFLRQEKRIHEMHVSKPLLSWIVYYLCDYGRSFTRLGAWIIFTWLFFGFLYAGYPVSFPFDRIPFCKAILTSVSPLIDWGHKGNACGGPLDFFTPYYYSLITMKTVGYGDISPKNLSAEIICGLQSILGYIFLGMFVSMLIAYMRPNND